jgi:uncharacterized protein (TIGR03435 family)
MKAGRTNIDDILKRGLRSASRDPRDQMAAVGERVLNNLLSKDAVADDKSVHASAAPVPMFPWFRFGMVGASAAVLLAVAVGTAWLRTPAKASQTVHSSEAAGRMIELPDGSRVEMRPHSRLSFEQVSDGVEIHLSEGGVIVNAAKQQDGQSLYIRTNDVTASVAGTVSLNSETEGSRFTVIEGEVRVRQQGAETKLLPGEQLATSPAMAPRLVEESLAWSRNASSHLARMEESAMTIALASAQAQEQMRPANTPKFEVVSIRPCGGDVPEPGARGGNGTPTPGIATPDAKLLRIVCVPVKYLIERAYVKWIESDVLLRPWYFPITGGPSWIETDAYSIEARAEGQPSMQEMKGPMLQVMLEDRFNLKIRREVREEPVYELRVADSGLKLQPLKEGECEAREAADKAERENLGKPPITVQPDGQLVINFTLAGRMMCGSSYYASRDGSRPPPGAGTFTLMGAPMSELIRFLDLDRIILDKTGIQGKFDIELTYGRYNSPMREPRAPLPDGVVPGGDTVFDALRKQLGLTLVRARGPRIYYHVESVTRPTPN